MAPVETVRPRLTFADLERMPDDGRRYELYDGEVLVVPSPLPIHQVVLARLTDILRPYARRHGGLCLQAPLDIVFSEYHVVQPDIVYFAEEKTRSIGLRQVIRQAPDLCVEVLSPSTAKRDRGRKLQMYARFDVREYWIADPVQLVLEQFELRDGKYQLRMRGADGDAITTDVMPGLMFSVREVFQDLADAP